jgi:hypothetical protein
MQQGSLKAKMLDWVNPIGYQGAALPEMGIAGMSAMGHSLT